MAGDWLKWVKGLPRKREVMLMATALDMDCHEVAGRLMALWEWCDDNVTSRECDADGNACVTLGASPERSVDRIVGVAGFAQAMADAGWLRLCDIGVTFPNFARHNGQTAKQRALTAKRNDKYRRKCDADSDGDSVTDVTVGASPEKRREELVLKKEEAAAAQLVASWAMPANASERRHRQALAAWQCVRKRAHGNYLDEISWEAAAMKYQHLSPDEWHAALMLSVERQSKGLCVRDYRDDQSRGKSKPKQTKPRLLTEEEIERYNATGELPEGALDQIGT